MTKLLSFPVVLLGSILLGGCAHQPWYHEMAERNPDCVGLVQHMSCEEFVASSHRVNSAMLTWQRIAHTEEERRIARMMYYEGLQNLSDVGDCSR